MTILLDHQFREKISHSDSGFPISFFHDELSQLPNWKGPLHWHPQFEIAMAQDSCLDFQVGKDHLFLNRGDSMFVNGNVLHGVRQVEGSVPDPMPNIVFDGSLLAAQDSLINRQYIQPIQNCMSLPFVLFSRENKECAPVHSAIREIFRCFTDKSPCFEMQVQRSLSEVFEYLIVHFDTLPRMENSRVQIRTQVRMQQMLSFIHDHFDEDITLRDIAGAAHVSRSEAGRCFQAYMGCAPIDALIQYRLQMAHAMLQNPEKPLMEICLACGFHSVNYFSRQFRRYYGVSPRDFTKLGKSC